MIADLVDKLIDRVIQPAKQQQEVRRNFQEFVTSIGYYLFHGFDSIHGTKATGLGIKELGPQHWRNILFQKLKEISVEKTLTGEEKKRRALMELDYVVCDMQAASLIISKHYMTSKTKYLK